MHTIIRIEEENHGLICIAEDYKSAVAYLINKGWFFDQVAVYSKDLENSKPMHILYGDNWREVFMNEWDINDFNEAFDGWFYLYEDEVYNANEDAD